MKITNPTKVLEYLSKNPTQLIFGFNPSLEKWIRVQYMPIYCILESKYPFYLLKTHCPDDTLKEESDFLIELLHTNYGRRVVDCEE